MVVALAKVACCPPLLALFAYALALSLCGAEHRQRGSDFFGRLLPLTTAPLCSFVGWWAPHPPFSGARRRMRERKRKAQGYMNAPFGCALAPCACRSAPPFGRSARAPQRARPPLRSRPLGSLFVRPTARGAEGGRVRPPPARALPATAPPSLRATARARFATARSVQYPRAVAWRTLGGLCGRPPALSGSPFALAPLRGALAGAYCACMVVGAGAPSPRLLVGRPPPCGRLSFGASLGCALCARPLSASPSPRPKKLHICPA